MKNGINVIYFGHEINTAFLLAHDEEICLRAVARNPTFIKYKTYNPVDKLFSIAYREHSEGGSRMLVLLCLRLFQLLAFLASPYFKIYKSFLALLVHRQIQIVNANKVDILTSFVKEHNIALFVINFWPILPDNIIRLPPLGCVNIHPSKLPMHKGALPTLWALKNKDKSSAVTYMLIDKTVDGGKIFAQHEFNILPTDTAIDLEKKIEDIVANTFMRDLKAFLENQLVPQEQRGAGCITGRFEPYRYIDFKVEHSDDIYNKILYYNYANPTQSCYSYHSGSKIIFKSCRLAEDKVQLASGYYSVKGLYLYVGCKDKALCFKAGKDIALRHFYMLYVWQLFNKSSFQSSKSVLRRPAVK